MDIKRYSDFYLDEIEIPEMKNELASGDGYFINIIKGLSYKPLSPFGCFIPWPSVN